MNQKTKTHITVYLLILLIFIISGLFFLSDNTNAETMPHQIVDLEPGWSVISTPRVLSGHKFSVSETSEYLDIYLLDPNSPSGWQTMQGSGQVEFRPLFSYFINNKTGQTQTLKLYYDYNLSPSQRLFDRSLNKGWNAIGIANPEYAIKKGATNNDTNNPSKILYSTIDCISDIIDFTADQSSLDSVKVGNVWTSKIATEVDNLNDLRELKAYGVYVTADNCLYRGSQNINDGLIFSLGDNNPTQLSFNSDNRNLLIFKVDSLYDLSIVSLNFSHSGTGSKNNISNFKLYDIDSGELLGSLANINGDGSLIFQNLNINTISGTNRKIKLIGDISPDATIGESHIFSLEDAVLDQEVVITGLPVSNSLNIIQGMEPGSLTISLDSVPTGAVNAAKGQTSISAISILFTAGSSSDMTLTNLVLSAYASDDGTTYTKGVTADGLYAKNVVSAVNIYESDGTTKIAGPRGFSGGPNDSDITFSSLSWNIPAGATKKMLVKVDITTATASGDYDYVYFNIDDTGHVTVVDEEGTSSNPAAVNINDGPTVWVSKSNGGTLAVEEAAAGIRPEPTYVYQGQTGAAFSKFKFTSTIEAFKIQKMTVELDAAGDEGNMTKVELSYPIDAAGTLVSPRPSGYFAGTASISFDLTGKEMYVPKDDYAYVTIYANLSTYADLGDQSADTWSLDFEGDGTTTFKAIGVGSSKKIEADDSNIVDRDGQAMYLYRTFPSFTLDGPASSTGATMPTKILEFTVTNHGDYDLVFNSTSGVLKFDVLGSGDVGLDPTFTLYKSDGTAVDTATGTNAGLGTEAIEFNFTDTTITIPKNGSQAFYIDITTLKSTWNENGDYMQFKLSDTNDYVKWDDGADANQVTYTSGLKNLGIPVIGPEFSISGL